MRNEGLLLTSVNMRTSAGPMRVLEDEARAATRGAIQEVGVFGGFPYADTAHAGASILVISDAALDPSGSEGSRVADAMMQRLRALAPQFEVRLPTARQAIDAALTKRTQGLVAVTDPADNPLSGGAGDTPELFRALLDTQIGEPALFASFADPAVVQVARGAGIGGVLDVTLVARYGRQFGEPVAIRAMVERITDGVFRNVGPVQTGVERRFGGSVMLRVERQPMLRVIVTQDVVPADDPAFYTLHGIELSALRLLCVKAKNHFRAAFESRCAAIIDCDAPGPAAVDLSKLAFRNAGRRQAFNV